MKKANLKVFSLLIVFVAMVGLLFGQVAMGTQCFAQEQVQQSAATQTKVVVTGSYKQDFDADSACVNVQIETLDLDKNVSKEKNKELLQKVISALEQEGISRENIEISYSHAYLTREGFSNCCGTRTYTTLNYQIDDLAALDSSIEKVYQAGGEVSSINFKLKDYQSKYNDLLSLAIESAKAKAKKLLGKEEVSLLKFKEECSYQCDSKYQSYYQGMGQELYNSKITVEAKVEIVAY